MSCARPQVRNSPTTLPAPEAKMPFHALYIPSVQTPMPALASHACAKLGPLAATKPASQSGASARVASVAIALAASVLPPITQNTTTPKVASWLRAARAPAKAACEAVSKRACSKPSSPYALITRTPARLSWIRDVSPLFVSRATRKCARRRFENQSPIASSGSHVAASTSASAGENAASTSVSVSACVPAAIGAITYDWTTCVTIALSWYVR